MWRPLALLDKLVGSAEDTIINFSMREARDSAWEFAAELVPLDAAAWDHAIFERDARVAKWGGTLVYSPGLIIRAVLFGVRVTGRGDVRSKTQLLSGGA